MVTSRPSQDFTVRSLVEAMGSVVKESTRNATSADVSATKVIDIPAVAGSTIPFYARKGEIIGLAGLGGHGQTATLLDLFAESSSKWFPSASKPMAFVAGDRALNGTFPLWSILRNLTIGNLPALSRRAAVNRSAETAYGEDWKQRMGIRTPDMTNPILSLSGGNQQKVLFARALAGDAAIVLMDDPMRGVDIGTKQEVYATLRREAAAGRTFIWYSTEMDEVRLCDRVYVFRDGVIVSELEGDSITEDNILAASFAGEAA